jgi:outer membrane protein assembly factor BamE (lipoprotein component of BamABCDE complex)
MNIHQTVCAIACAATLTSCMSSGTYVDEAQVTKFKKGETTIQQVEKALGAPGSRTLMPNGDTAIGYTYVESTARPESFIPLVGGLVGGADSRMTMASFVFDSKGVLVNSTYTGSQNGTAMNLSSGAPVLRVYVKARRADQSPTADK